jgi:hypothetical protein
MSRLKGLSSLGFMLRSRVMIELRPGISAETQRGVADMMSDRGAAASAGKRDPAEEGGFGAQGHDLRGGSGAAANTLYNHLDGSRLDFASGHSLDAGHDLKSPDTGGCGNRPTG